VACAWACVGNAGQLAQSGAGPAIARGPLDADFGEAPAVTEARLHVVRACLAAADLQADSDLRVSQATSDGWAALSSRRARIASTVVEVSGVPAPVAIALLTTRRAHARAPVASLPATVPP
jgi:hypothetical protein